MAGFCLPPKIADVFLKGIEEGKIDPATLAGAESSAERRQLLAKYVGIDNVHQVNALYESKFLLKDQQAGMERWIKGLAGIDKATKKTMVDKVLALQNALDKNGIKSFMEDLTATKLGVSVTEEEAKKITELAKIVAEKKQEGSGYGMARVKLENYVDSLKGEKFKPSDILAIQRAMQTGYDVSSAGRQAAPYAFSKEYREAFNPLKIKSYLKQEGVDRLKARIYENKYWEDANKLKNELGMTMFGGSREETFFSKAVNKVAGLSAAERIYDAPLNDLRFHRFANTLAAYEKAGVPLSDQMKKQLAETIAAATGRGKINAGSLGTVLFSPRWLKSRLDLITNVATKSGPARKEAAKTLAMVLGETVGTISLFNFGHKYLDKSIPSVEMDPRNSDAYKVKIGNTRIDLTQGYGSLIRLVAQLGTQSTKTSSGSIVKLNSDQPYSQTGLEVLANFFRGKSSPATSLFIDTVVNRKDFNGNPLGISIKDLKSEKNINTIKRIAGMFEPMLASDSIEAFRENAGMPTNKRVATTIGAGLASFVGVGVNTYSPRLQTGADWIRLKEQKGESVYKQANKDFETIYQKDLEKLKNTSLYKNSDDSKRADLIKAVKDNAVNKIFKQQKYSVKQPPKTKKGLSANDLIKKAGIK